MITRRIMLVIVSGASLAAGCAGRLDAPSAPSLTNSPPSSSFTASQTVDLQTPTAPTRSLTHRCTNSRYGFSVSYPTGWYTNDDVEVDGERVAGCTLFAPFADFDVLPEVTNVPLFLKQETGSLPPDGTPLTIDGRPGVLVDTGVGGHAWRVYYARISDQTRFAAFAFDNGSAPFEESRAVLDAMIGTVNLDGG